MATRYSGDLKINVTYDDRNFYRASVSRGDKLLWRGRVNPAPAGFGPGVAYDSPQAYDEVAVSALAFADDDVGDIGDTAEYNDNMTGYLIRRPKTPAKTASHATRKRKSLGPSPTATRSMKTAGIKRDVGDSWLQRARELAAQEALGSSPIAPLSTRYPRRTGERRSAAIVVRKVEGRWQPVTTSGIIVRGSAYNADGRGYSTKQGADEAAQMIRRLGKSA